ncbi:MAG TPA: hypothetical protein VM925_14640, partial [Labilithrix sp.]|nr:hypothetical protein [Labilithrix sp.]
MSAVRIAAGLLVAAITLFSMTAGGATPAASGTATVVPEAHDADAIDRTARSAYAEGSYAFCSAPSRPLGARQLALCPLAAEIEGCEGFAKACALGRTPKDRDWFQVIAALIAPVAHVLLYLLVLGVGIALAIPVIQA